MIIESRIRTVGSFPPYPEALIRREQSQARVPIEVALRTCGPVHRAFIDALPTAWRRDRRVEIFSRLLYLKPGWYPLSPHYHFDWRQGADGARVETIMVLLGDASRTEFVLGPLEHPDSAAELGEGRPPLARGERRQWDDVVEAGLRDGRLRTWHLEPATLVRFDNRTLHRASPATKAGWRLLMRAIRGLPERDEESGRGFRNPGRFMTCRNGFVPQTDAERAAYEPYR